MGTSTLTIDLNAVVANWRSLDAMSDCETAAVVKANGYGLGAPSVARALAKAGARTFFVAVAEEGPADHPCVDDGGRRCRRLGVGIITTAQGVQGRDELLVGAPVSRQALVQ